MGSASKRNPSGWNRLTRGQRFKVRTKAPKRARRTNGK